MAELQKRGVEELAPTEVANFDRKNTPSTRR